MREANLKNTSIIVQVEPALEKQLATCMGLYMRREVVVGGGGGGGGGCGGCLADTTGPCGLVDRCTLQTLDFSKGIMLLIIWEGRVQGSVDSSSFML
jgi:hypothetical protein